MHHQRPPAAGAAHAALGVVARCAGAGQDAPMNAGNLQAAAKAWPIARNVCVLPPANDAAKSTTVFSQLQNAALNAQAAAQHCALGGGPLATNSATRAGVIADAAPALACACARSRREWLGEWRTRGGDFSQLGMEWWRLAP